MAVRFLDEAAPVEPVRPHALKVRFIEEPLAPGTAPQVGQPVPTVRELRTYLPAKEDVPELLGTALGSIAVGAAGGGHPLARGAGAALGAAGGEGFKQLGQRAGLFPGAAPSTSLEARGRIESAAVRGLGSEVFGMGVEKGIGKLFAPFRGSFTDASKEGLRIAERENIKLPLSMMSSSPAVQTMERAAEFSYNPWGARLTSIRNKAVQDLEGFARKIAAKISSHGSREVQGALAKEGVASYPERFIALKNQMYGALGGQLDSLPVTPSNTLKTLDALIERESAVPKYGRPEIFEAIKEMLVPGSYETKTGGRILTRPAARSGIPPAESVASGGAIIGRAPATGVSGGDSGFLMSLEREFVPTLELKGARGGGAPKGTPNIPSMLTPSAEVQLQRELYGSVAPGGLPGIPYGLPGMASLQPEAPVSNFIKLNRLQEFVGRKVKYEDPSIRGLGAELREVTLAMSKDLDEVASKFSPDLAGRFQEANAAFENGIKTLQDALFKSIEGTTQSQLHTAIVARNAPEQIRLAREIIGDEGMQAVARQWLDDIIEKSIITAEGSEAISPRRLANNIRRYGTSVKELFIDNPEVLGLIKDVEYLGASMTRGERVVQGSQTPFALSGMGAVWNLLRHPGLSSLAIFGGTAAGARAISSDVGRQLLTEGFPEAGRRAGTAVGRAAQISGQRLLQEGR